MHIIIGAETGSLISCQKLRNKRSHNRMNSREFSFERSMTPLSLTEKRCQQDLLKMELRKSDDNPDDADKETCFTGESDYTKIKL